MKYFKNVQFKFNLLRLFIFPYVMLLLCPIYYPNFQLNWENLKGKQNVIYICSIIFPGNLCNIYLLFFDTAQINGKIKPLIFTHYL